MIGIGGGQVESRAGTVQWKEDDNISTTTLTTTIYYYPARTRKRESERREGRETMVLFSRMLGIE